MNRPSHLFYLLFFLFSQSCLELTNPYSAPSRILIIGNSITHSDPIPDRGWTGSWGMAASSRQNDFVHILADSIRMYQPQADIRFTNKGTRFENNFQNFRIEDIPELLDFEPDMVILRLGDNVDTTLVHTEDFDFHFSRFIKSIQENNAHIICTSTFWERKEVSNKMKEICINHEMEYVELQDLFHEDNMAYQQFHHVEVASHPGDLGMLRIAGRIWYDVKPFFAGTP